MASVFYTDLLPQAAVLIARGGSQTQDCFALRDSSLEGVTYTNHRG